MENDLKQLKRESLLTDQRNNDGETTLFDQFIDGWQIIDKTIRVENHVTRNDFDFDQSRRIENILEEDFSWTEKEDLVGARLTFTTCSCFCLSAS